MCLPNDIAEKPVVNVVSIQLIWSIMFSHGSAYLFSLDVTKAQSSFIWAIGPVCGAIVQPIVGAVADNSRSRWGRRRPFMLAGASGVAVSLIALAWISNSMRALSAAFGVHSHESVKTAIQIGTVICITLLNLSMQPLQSGVRALIVDVCPSEQQSIASAWAARFTGISNILGYILGSLPFNFFTHDNEAWRFRFLSIISIIALLVSIIITAYFIHEDDPRELTNEPPKGIVFLGTFRNLKMGWLSMPYQARRVCFVQFFAWMGWFGVLFYSTSYVGRMYVTEMRRSGIEHFELLRDAGTRLGTFASLLSSALSLATTILAPHIASTKSTASLSKNIYLEGLKVRSEWLRQIHIIWAFSLLFYAFCTLSTIFVLSTNMAIVVIALTGVPWGVTQWAPFALLGEEIAIYEDESDSATEKGGQQSITNLSGTMLGVHNAAISVPQILAALGSGFIFWCFDGNGSRGDNGIAWVLRAGGIAAIFAAYFAWRLK